MKLEEVIIADSQGGKRVRLYDETYRKEKLTSIVVIGETGEGRRFCRHEDALFKDEPAPNGIRKFRVENLAGGKVEIEKREPQAPNPRPKQPARNKSGQDRSRSSKRPSGNQSKQGRRHDLGFLFREVGKEAPEDFGAPLDGKAIKLT